MSTGSTFPTTLDTFVDKVDGIDDILAVETNTQSSAIEALEAKVGINNSAVATSLDYRINALEDNLDTSGALDDQVLTVDSGLPAGYGWKANPGGFADPTTSAGDIIYRNASNVLTRLPKGNQSQVLEVGATTIGYQNRDAVNFFSAGYAPGSSSFNAIQNSGGAAQNVEIEDNNKIFYGTDGAVFRKTGGNSVVSLSAADATNPRWDLVSLDASAGTYTATAGTAAANPVKPSTPANEDAICYVYRAANDNTVNTRDIQNVAVVSTVKSADGHFKTNFSINQKEDTEDSEYETQQYFQQLSFGTKFDTVNQDRTFLHTVDTFGVRADCDEITYTGTWSNDDSSNYRFGRAKTSSTANDTAVFSFFGVAVGISMYCGTSEGFLIAELSSDGGATYGSKITITPDTGSATFNNFFDLYTGLTIGEYKLKITIGRGVRIIIDHFYYTTYCIQRPASLFAMKTGSGGTAATVADVPPAINLLTGTWGTAKNDNSTTVWNATESRTTTAGDYVEFKFYGSKIWLHITQDTDADSDIDFTIDGATTYVRNTTGFNPDTPNNRKTLFYRIDNGSLPEGWHTVKVTATAITGSNYFYFGGFSFYSATAPSTICRSLILGKSSYALGVDSSGITYSGTWVGVADNTTGFLRRQNITVTNASYAAFTTPTNVKAIYMVCAVDNSTIGAEIKITLAGAKARYVDTQTNDYQLDSFIIPIYDSFADGDLDSQELRIIHNDTTTSTSFSFQGLILEIGNPVENDYLMAMPKWTRYNASTNADTPVSNTYRLDVYGVKSDLSAGRLPEIHSGWMFGAGNAAFYYRAGVLMKHYLTAHASFFSRPIMGGTGVIDVSEAAISYGINYNNAGLFYKQAGTSASTYWQKVNMILKEVV